MSLTIFKPPCCFFSRPCHLGSKLKSETLTLMMIRRWLLIQNIDVMTSLQYLFIYLFPGDKCLLKVREVGTGHWRAFPVSNYMFVINNHLNLLKFNNEETRTLSTDIMFFNLDFVYVWVQLVTSILISVLTYLCRL